MSQTIIIVTMVVYLAGMLAIGFIYSRKSSGSLGEFYLGNRKLGPVITAMSAEASDMSSYLLMGIPGLAYSTGIAEAFWTILGLTVGTYLNWLIVSKRLRRYSERIGAITVPEFFAKRFGDKKHILSCVAAVVIVVFFVPYTASGFKAVGTLFSTLFNMDYHTAMIIGAVFVVTYTVLGGFLAVSTTDLVQSVVMTIALIVILFFGISHAGGWGAVTANAANLTGYFNVFQGYNIFTKTTGSYGFLPIVSTLAWGLGYFGMPHILLRFMAVRDEAELKTSRRIASIWVVISMSVAMVIGFAGLANTAAGNIRSFTDGTDAESVIIALSDFMSRYGAFFGIAAGLVLSGILASTMSTADSQLLAAASSVSKDLLGDFFGVKTTQKITMLVARLTVFAIAIVAVILAWDPNSSVFRVVSFAWAGFGGAFGPLMLCALLWRRTNRQGAIAGMIAGGAMIFIWKYLVRPLGGAWDIYELLPAFVISLAVIVIVSLATAEPEPEITKTYDEVMR